jgi:hypothetical protein
MSNKVFVLAPKEDWICDRFVSEWIEQNSDITVSNPEEADVIWLLADWCAGHLPQELLSRKKVLASVHHIYEPKFDNTFYLGLDSIVNVWHTPAKSTAEFMRMNVTSKPIFTKPFWVNGNIWNTMDKIDARKKLGLPEKAFIVGSFQRDTEGSDLISPKLEKGPDFLCDTIEKLATIHKDIFVILGGWRRQYVMKRLNAAGIYYDMFDRPELSKVNAMYNALDLYVVSARCEGGPQAIVECAVTETPIVSYDVGIAKDILAPESILPVGSDLTTASPNVAFARKAVQKYLMPNGMDEFRKIILEM